MAVNFWQKLKKPIFVLAPMANVTDAAFRKMIAKYGKPDVIWTEFVSANGLISPGRKILLNDLKYSPGERPIVAQLFTSSPEVMLKASQLVAKLGFDGLDLNMGCPDRSVEKQGSGAAHIKDATTALKVLQAAREGAPNLPISIKTRIGYNKIDIENWIGLLLKQNPPVLTVHLRTRKEMSDVPAHWDLMPSIVALRDKIQKDLAPAERTIIIGNGDVSSLEDAKEKVKKYGCDGIMVGRGIFGTPWFFDEKASPKSPRERLKIMLEHAKLFEKMFGGENRVKNFSVMKKHFKAYVSGWDGAKELRVKLMEAESYKEVEKIVKKYITSL